MTREEADRLSIEDAARLLALHRLNQCSCNGRVADCIDIEQVLAESIVERTTPKAQA